MARVLVTNDDGIDAPGLHRLAEAMVEAGHDVVVAAPLDDRSGSGAAIGRIHRDDHIDLVRRSLPGLDGVPAYGVAGTPALCVMAARLGGLGAPPEAVVSGINPGCNTGRSVLHSGTVGAALTATNFGLPGVAVSIDASAALVHEATSPGVRSEADADEGAPGPRNWETAGVVAAATCRWVLTERRTCTVNVNVPDTPLATLRGVRPAELATFGRVRIAVVEAGADRLQMEMRDTDHELPADTDTALVDDGYAAITVISGVRALATDGIAAAVEDDLMKTI